MCSSTALKPRQVPEAGLIHFYSRGAIRLLVILMISHYEKLGEPPWGDKRGSRSGTGPPWFALFTARGFVRRRERCHSPRGRRVLTLTQGRAGSRREKPLVPRTSDTARESHGRLKVLKVACRSQGPVPITLGCVLLFGLFCFRRTYYVSTSTVHRASSQASRPSRRGRSSCTGGAPRGHAQGHAAAAGPRPRPLSAPWPTAPPSTPPFRPGLARCLVPAWLPHSPSALSPRTGLQLGSEAGTFFLLLSDSAK